MRRNVSGIAIERTRVHSGTNAPRGPLALASGTLAVVFFALASMSAGANPAPAPAGQPKSQASPSTPSSPASSAKKKPLKKRKKTSSRQSSQKAPTPDRITEIQSALARGGYYQGDPNGKWDANTVAAMQKFQSSNGLEANGKLDALSLQKLGLGSDIAGVSAPKQPTKPSGTASLTPYAAPPATAPPAPSANSGSGQVRQGLGGGGSPSASNLQGSATVAASTPDSR
jgi:peptidoglycan hydrolase-like protein with peptidoglycan-binding domain